MEPQLLQQALFNALKKVLPAHVSMADELSSILSLSHDSVYRRMRGEKSLSIDELKKLSDHFNLSLDQILQIKNDSIVFAAPGINDEVNDFKVYLQGILSRFQSFNTYQRNEMLYLCKDLFVWHFFSFPEVAAFKTFCWIKTIQNKHDYQNKLFSLSQYPFDDCIEIGQQIIKEYNKIPSVELWNFESLNSSISQLEYYRDAGLFAEHDDFARVLQSMEKMLDHFQQLASTGLKGNNVPFRFYVNEVILGNNSILVQLDDTRLAFINYNILKYLVTRDSRFTQQSFDSFHNLISRSTLISGTGEKSRNKFFGYLKDKVRRLKTAEPSKYLS